MPAREIARIGRADRPRHLAAILPALDHAHQRIRAPSLRIDPRRFHHLLEHAQLIVRIEDREARREPDQRRMPPQHPRAQRMERAQPQPLDRLLQDRADALAHLARRLVGERHRQHLAGERPVREQDMREPCRQHPRLPGPGAGEHQHGSIHRLDGASLLGVEAEEMVVRRHTSDIAANARTGTGHLTAICEQ